MKRWYFAIAMFVVVSSPLVAVAQTNFGGGTGNGGGAGLGGGTGSTGSSTGQINTTILGNQVNLNFNSVFGTSATLANTNTDNFSAYRPSGSGTGSSTGVGSAFSGTGMGTGGTTNRTGTAGGGLGGATNRTGAGLGTAGGGLGGGALGGQRNALGGNTFGGNAAGFGGQRNAFGGNTGGFLGGGMGGFLGGGMNNQQQNTATMGYTVNYEGKVNPGSLGTAGGTITNNIELQQRLVTSPGIQGAVNLQVMMKGETAILRGQVGSDYAKQLAAAMVRLEPGVYSVENQLVVAPPQK